MLDPPGRLFGLHWWLRRIVVGCSVCFVVELEDSRLQGAGVDASDDGLLRVATVVGIHADI